MTRFVKPNIGVVMFVAALMGCEPSAKPGAATATCKADQKFNGKTCEAKTTPSPTPNSGVAGDPSSGGGGSQNQTQTGQQQGQQQPFNQQPPYYQPPPFNQQPPYYQPPPFNQQQRPPFNRPTPIQTPFGRPPTGGGGGGGGTGGGGGGGRPPAGGGGTPPVAGQVQFILNLDGVISVKFGANAGKISKLTYQYIAAPMTGGSSTPQDGVSTKLSASVSLKFVVGEKNCTVDSGAILMQASQTKPYQC